MTLKHLTLLLLLARVAAPWPVVAASSADPPAYAPGRLVIKVSDGLAPHMRAAGRAGGPGAKTGVPGLDDLLTRDGVRGIRAPFAHRQTPAAIAARFPRRTARAAAGASSPALDRIFIVDLSPDTDMEAAAREYARLPGVEWAEPDREMHAAFTPNDPFFSSSGSWGQPFRDLWGLPQISAPAAWDVTHGAGVVVAVSDTGVDRAHPDIAAHMWTNAGEIPGNEIDDDGNGFVDDTYGWDFVNGDNDPFDDNGHGTHCAGTIAAIGNNGVGITGIAWEASVMAVKGLSAGGSGYGTELAAGIIYAADNGADVINASWGGGLDYIVRDAVTAAHDAGVVFVAAAGNAAVDVRTFYPAAYPDALAVAATDHLDQLASFSNFGPRIDVAAPGGGDLGPPDYQPSRSILSLRSSGTTFDSGLHVASLYTRQAGTSMAAPHVSGAAALVIGAHPSFSPEQVRQALRASTDDIDAPGFDLRVAYGRLNVGRAVLLDDVLVSRITSPAFAVTVDGTVSVIGTAAGPGFESYVLEYGRGAVPFVWQPIAGPVTTPVESGLLGTWDLSTTTDGDYVLRLRAQTSDGHSFEDRVPVVVDNVRITKPARGDAVGAAGSPIEIRGTASGYGFVSYRIQYRIITPPDPTGLVVTGGWTSAGITLAGGGASPVIDGFLGTLDPAALPGPREIDMRLIVNNTDGTTVDQVLHIAADPTLHAGWPRRFGPTAQFNVTLADLDGDGGKEILLVNQGQVYALRADGTDLPGWPQASNASSPPAVADMDGDLQPEVVTSVGVGYFDIRHGDGSLMATIPIPFPYAPRGPVSLVDVDGDGQRDLVYVTQSNAEGYLTALHANGTFVHNFPKRWRCLEPARNCLEDGVAVGDTDGDGSPELAVIANDDSGRQYLHVYGADGALKRAPKRTKAKRRYADNPPVMADFDGDGALDVTCNDDQTKVTASTGSGKKIRLPRGSGLPGYSARIGGPLYKSKQEPISAADLDGDGVAEMLVGRSFPDFAYVHGKPTIFFPPYLGVDYIVAVGRFLTPPASTMPIPYLQSFKSYGPGAIAIGDVDGDGRQDVVVGTGMAVFYDLVDVELTREYTLYAFRPDGTLLPGFPKPTPAHGTRSTTMPALGDLDGDGLKEIVWLDAGGNLLVWTVAGTPGPENMQWPMYRHDAAHTGALVNQP